MVKRTERLFEMIRSIRPRDAEFYSLVYRFAEEPVSIAAEDAPAESSEESRTAQETGGRLQLPLLSRTA